MPIRAVAVHKSPNFRIIEAIEPDGSMRSVNSPATKIPEGDGKVSGTVANREQEGPRCAMLGCFVQPLGRCPHE